MLDRRAGVGVVVMVRVFARITGMVVVVRRDLSRVFGECARARSAFVRTLRRSLVHDGPDGPGTAAALRAATEAAIDLACHARRIGPDHGADLVVGQDVTGADDHVPALLAAMLVARDELSAIAIRLQKGIRLSNAYLCMSAAERTARRPAIKRRGMANNGASRALPR